MDVNGAKALKRRLGPDVTDEAPAPASVDVPEDAPPVYHWLGVSKAPPEAASVRDDDEPEAGRVSLFRRLGLSSR